jgi:predicted MPP superfamily phosphohydrolase
VNRRRFLALSGAAAASGAVGLGGYAGLVEPRRVRFTRHRVGARTSPAQREATIVQVSDLHLQSVGAMHRRMAARTNAIRPDLLLFTGDSVDRADRLGELADVYRRAGCRLLVNESAVHDVGGRALRITGLDDLIGGRRDARRAFAGVEPADAHLLLAHCPEHRDRLILPPHPFDGPGPHAIDPARITMMLSGHTHGGQVNLLGWAPVVPPGSGRYLSGWFRDPGAVPLYVSRGMGTSVVPFRLGSPPEVAVFTMWV